MKGFGREPAREHGELYTNPLFYDIAFDVRETRRECDFLTWCVQKLAGRRLGSVLELAAGPGYHAMEFARRGTRTIALDIEPAMVEYLRMKATARNLSVEVVQGDMRAFGLDRPVDLACILFGSFCYLLTIEDITACLASVHAALEPGGLFVLELPHPRKYLRHDDVTQDEWICERDGMRVSTRWDIDRGVPDPLTQVVDIRSEFVVEAQGRKQRFRTRGRQRVMFAQELCALAEGSGLFRIVSWFGAMERRVRFDYTRSAWRMVAVLQKV